MPRTDARGGPQTRARISQIATELFLARGFDAVTVAEVARAAGVSSVTVFKHFPRKEDLLFDREGETADLLRSLVRDRPRGSDVLEVLRAAALRLGRERHPLSGLAADSVPFLRTVTASPALVARSREIAATLQRTLAAELDRAVPVTGAARLLAAFLLAGYTTVFVDNATRLVAGESPDAVARDHDERVDALFDALRDGVPAH